MEEQGPFNPGNRQVGMERRTGMGIVKLLGCCHVEKEQICFVRLRKPG